jgi:hypothetical protein
MKTFMLGWEFPPHLSSGPGIACRGSTKVINKVGIKVTFVLPMGAASHIAGSIKMLNDEKAPLMKIPSQFTEDAISQAQGRGC